MLGWFLFLNFKVINLRLISEHLRDLLKLQWKSAACDAKRQKIYFCNKTMTCIKRIINECSFINGKCDASSTVYIFAFPFSHFCVENSVSVKLHSKTNVSTQWARDWSYAKLKFTIEHSHRLAVTLFTECNGTRFTHENNENRKKAMEIGNCSALWLCRVDILYQNSTLHVD